MKNYAGHKEDFLKANPGATVQEIDFYAKAEAKKEMKTRIDVAKEYKKRDIEKAQERVGKAYLISANSKNITLRIPEEKDGIKFDPDVFIEEVGDAGTNHALLFQSSKELVANCSLSAYKILAREREKLGGMNLELNNVRTEGYVLIEKVK